MNIKRELEAFDKLPIEIRQFLNYTEFNIDPRFILGMYKQQGHTETINYLNSLGFSVENY